MMEDCVSMRKGAAFNVLTGDTDVIAGHEERAVGE